MNLLPLLGIILLLAFLSGSDSLFYLGYLVGGLVLVTFAWMRQIPHSLSSERRFPARAFHGEQVPGELVITNRGRWPILWLRVHDSLPVALHSPNFVRRIVSLAPGESATLPYELVCRRRGYYQLGPLLLRTGDFFDLLPECESTGAATPFIVYPRVIPLRRLDLPSQIPYGGLATPQHIFPDPSRFFGVREYQPGDSLRQVNWKSSARFDQLLVKRFQPAIGLNAMIVLNLNSEDYTLRGRVSAGEMGIVVAASMAAHLVERRQRVGLSVLGTDAVTGRIGLVLLPSARGREHLMRALEALARAELGATSPFVQCFDHAGTRLGWGSSMIVITPGETEHLVPTLLRMQRQGFHVLLVATDPQTSFGGFKRRLAQIGVPAFWVTEEKDLDVWR